MRIAAIVCENGLGHFKRTMSLLCTLQRRRPDLEVDLVCEAWQWQAWKVKPAGIRIHTGLLHPGVYWDASPQPFQTGALLAWEERLKELPALYEADLVLSDNLAGVLSLRPDAVLLGSFLWGEVFEAGFKGDPAIDAFVAHERSLLEAVSPPMICVGEIAMPWVQTYTQPAPVHWMSEWPKRERPAQEEIRRVAVLGGATSLAQSQLDVWVKTLLRETDWEIAVRGGSDDPRLVSFTFDQEAYSACQLVFCRPGVGTITDCIATGTPMVFLRESGNAEMDFNAKILALNGLGLESDDLSAIADPAWRHRAVDIINQRPVDGLEQAAAWLLDQF